MADIKPATTEVPTQKLFPIIGKAWVNKDKKGRDCINIIIGNRRQNIEQVGEVTVRPNDKFYLRTNIKRPGKKDPDYQVCLVQ